MVILRAARPVGSTGSPRLALLKDGRVLVAGGGVYANLLGSPEYSSAVEILDPVTGDWQLASSMNVATEHLWLFTLNDGRVLALSRANESSGNSMLTVEVYDPDDNMWAALSSHDPHYLPSDAVQLQDGRLLVLD